METLIEFLVVLALVLPWLALVIGIVIVTTGCLWTITRGGVRWTVKRLSSVPPPMPPAGSPLEPSG